MEGPQPYIHFIQMPHNFLSPNGFPILVGRNSRENDILTFQTARPHDYWFHVSGSAGAHVILQVMGHLNQKVEREDIQYAANIAATFSKANQQKMMPVTVCRAIDIEKPRYAKCGMVRCTCDPAASTIMASPLQLQHQ